MAIEKKIIEEYTTGVYEGVISVFNLPGLLFEYNFNELIGAAAQGFNLKGLSELNKPTFVAGFTENINVMGASKEVSQVWQMEKAVFNPDGTKAAFKDFKKVALNINENYNVNYLKTEQAAAFSQAQAADQYFDAQQTKDALPFLQYQTVGDGRVRPEHAAWNGIIKPVDDEFWDTRQPINDWGCRCRIIKLARAKPTDLNEHLEQVNKRNIKQGKPRIETLENQSKVFSNNAAKDKYIWNPDAIPYKADASAAGVKEGKNNYGLGFKKAP